ncbi:MAG: adenylyl cyclase [Acidobacteria bacterium]|nr:adenylyl cyclase [Acidobacteriota bacterium]
MKIKGNKVAAIILALGALPLLAASAAAAQPGESSPAAPDFGPNVIILTPSISTDEINGILKKAAAKSTGFDENRTAIYFMPGRYGAAATGADDPKTAKDYVSSTVGFMETISGLGESPDEVDVTGNLSVWGGLGTFWRAIANMKITPIQADETPHTMRWNTSQASSLRRVYINGSLDLAGGRTFGTVMANSKVTGEVRSGMLFATDPPGTGQAQYYTRDSEIGNWVGRAMNFVYTGVKGAPPTDFAAPGDKTTLATTPVSRDAPFLFFQGGQYKVFVPKARLNASGINWGISSKEGTVLPISQFFIAKPNNTAAEMNKALASGKHILLTPGVYKLDESIHVTRANSVILGMGLPSLTPLNGQPVIETDDVPGVIISSLFVDSNGKKTDALLRIGPARARRGEAANPTTLNDIYVRVGAMYAGSATTSIEVNQNHTLIDHTWLWRGDHGNRGAIGWTVSTGDHGLVVNGDNVTVLGLFVEHYQKTEVIWNGDGGRTIFLQSEVPHDLPSQAEYRNGDAKNYPIYAVSPQVTSHEGIGFAMYVVFTTRELIEVDNFITAPKKPGVKFRSLTAGWTFGHGQVNNIINDTGGSVGEKGPSSHATNIRISRQMAEYPIPAGK